MIVGCSNPEVNQKKDSQSEDVAIDLSDVDTNLVPSLNEVIKETDKKKELFPDAYKKSWLITEMQKDFEFVGAGNQSITEMAKNYKNAVTTGILLKLAKRSIDYEAIKKDKYADLSCDIDFTGIKKGDVLLTLTRNPALMACDGEDVPHHALLCIADPTSDDSNVFITTNGLVKPDVSLYPLSFLKKNDDIIIVLRLYNPDVEIINKIVDFAMQQLGKTYNMYFTDKMTTEKFYCTQLVWRAYKEAGVDIDSNGNKFYDYGLVLASDIYKSPYLYIVKYSY
ncbi:MAG TPA: YiiX/YebB-like N1pC/P60 family cysteine hydrolase [Spirochaetota bacterium]|nr:YiiX/YebB-like N1pC/P60 family cysteine hydrolase [Spirochaetota bacterium]